MSKTRPFDQASLEVLEGCLVAPSMVSMRETSPLCGISRESDINGAP